MPHYKILRINPPPEDSDLSECHCAAVCFSMIYESIKGGPAPVDFLESELIDRLQPEKALDATVEPIRALITWCERHGVHHSLVGIQHLHSNEGFDKLMNRAVLELDKRIFGLPVLKTLDINKAPDLILASINEETPVVAWSYGRRPMGKFATLQPSVNTSFPHDHGLTVFGWVGSSLLFYDPADPPRRSSRLSPIKADSILGFINHRRIFHLSFFKPLANV